MSRVRFINEGLLVRFINESLCVGIEYNPFRYSVLVAVTAEYPLSYEYVEEGGRMTLIVFSLNSSYSLWTFVQNNLSSGENCQRDV